MLTKTECTACSASHQIKIRDSSQDLFVLSLRRVAWLGLYVEEFTNRSMLERRGGDLHTRFAGTLPRLPDPFLDWGFDTTPDDL